MSSRRARLEVRGAVQGVGFRPFAAQLARSMGLSGFVQNAGFGAVVEVEGPAELVDRFVDDLREKLPPPGRITDLERSAVGPLGAVGFRIAVSDDAPSTAQVLPDQSTCEECLRELLDPDDRRYRYPFINCTRCGPRYSIIESLPYDRARTTMARFTMCSACQSEYDDPTSRRFHAQPNACPSCGPGLWVRDRTTGLVQRGHRAIEETVRLLSAGAIVAAKGIGGFHLLCNAQDPAAVGRLRARKARTHKPFALMLPGLQAARDLCELSALEERTLISPAAPILLAQRRSDATIRLAPEVSPDNLDLGLMLPYAPMYHLLMSSFAAPLVATSANLAEEPLCSENDEALHRLRDIADAFLLHDRPIARCCDDSVVRVMAERVVVLRRGRGLAPAVVAATADTHRLLAVGGHLKASLAASSEGGIVSSPHVGDLDSPESRRHHRRVGLDLMALFPEPPQAIVADLHPDYGSRALADELASDVPLLEIQHHEAHLWSCLADNGAAPPCLGVVWDGMGLGHDGNLWGGEFLLARGDSVDRFAHMQPFSLVGGDAAARDGRRAALGLLQPLLGEAALDYVHLDDRERAAFRHAMATGSHLTWTTSVGRLFDGVAAILGVCERSAFEGHAPQQLEFCARQSMQSAEPYAVEVRSGEPAVVDWRPALRALLDDREAGRGASVCAARFHATLVDVILRVARMAGQRRVALSGGCFQNPTLLSRSVERLRAEGFEPLWHREVPPNDGGLAVGQIVAAARAIGLERKRETPCA